MIKSVLCVISIVLVIIDVIIFLNLKRYVKEHENELIEKHNKSLLAGMIAMVIIPILAGVIGVIIQFL